MEYTSEQLDEMLASGVQFNPLEQALIEQLSRALKEKRDILNQLMKYESAIAATLDIMPLGIQIPDVPQWVIARRSLEKLITDQLAKNRTAEELK